MDKQPYKQANMHDYNVLIVNVRIKEITIKSVHTGTLACSKTEIHSLWKNKTLLDLSI